MKWLALALALLLAACSPAPSPLNQYPQRLANVFDVKAPAVSLPLLANGGGRQWALTVPEVTVNVKQAYALRHCNLLGLISERNAPLGKTAPPSQRFLYEVKLLAALKACQPQDESLQQLVQQLVSEKSASLPLVAWRLVSDDEAFRANWRHDRAPLKAFAGIQNAQTLFSDISALLKGDDEKRQARLEDELGDFENSRILARLNQQLSDGIHSLNAVTTLIKRQGPKLVCIHGHPGSQAKRVRDFFFSYYGKQVQPYLGQLVATDRALKGSLWPLIAHLPHPKDPNIAFLASQQPDSLSGQFMAALHRHTHAWQQLLGRCGLAPGP
ncbi:DUF3080 family protein [Gallaecimonas mangrovi]|uniref:DUF3080 family protein n=1 Tax=Gallaecimonas mangrovi TaxID=2291597 RepID=UPI000E207D12|nr:DUF3080 family protein [Gallaecimonas mangrovi]